MFWWVELYFFSLECNEVSSSEFWDVCVFGVTSSSLYIKAQGYVPALLENLHDVFSGTFCLLGGACFQCRYGDFWMNSYQLILYGVRSSLVFSGFGLKPPASGFQFYSYSSLKTSASIHHNDKTSRLMEKRFSTMSDPQKDLLSYMKKRRGKRWPEGEEGEYKGEGGRNLPINQIPMCSS